MNFYFFLSPYENWTKGKSRYQHEIIVLAEGLTTLGHTCIGNINYWPLNTSGKDYLVKQAEFDAAFQYDAIILSGMQYANTGKKIPTEIVQARHKVPLVFTDLFDGHYTPTFYREMQLFDLILKCHYNNRYNNPANAIPWAFGIPSRYTQFIKQASFETRDASVLWNFRIHHGLRKKAQAEVMPVLSKYFAIDNTIDPFDANKSNNKEEDFWWKHSGQRHNQAYFNNLANKQIIACFGGGLIGQFHSTSILHKILRKITSPFLSRFDNTMYQWDSYRFWESLSAGSVVLNYDITNHGAKFPVNPKPGVHFWGIDLKSPEKSVKIMAENPAALSAIGQQGFDWALEHYTALPTAKRFLSLLEAVKQGNLQTVKNNLV